MAEHDSERRPARGLLLIGAGRRAREVGRVLWALSALDGLGEPGPEALGQQTVDDLEELLARRPLEGLLILESARVPGEDIGFVRRFLERHPLWRLLVIGEDGQEPRVKVLLALGRAQWLPWPPDLEQLRALLSGARAAESVAPAPEAPARSGEERVPARKPGRRGVGAGTSNGAVDLGHLLEELLASAALQGEGASRYQFRAGQRVLVQRERALLQEGLGGLVELARVCAGAEGLVQAVLEPSGDSVRVGLEFPRAGLPERDLGALFERAPEGLEEGLSRGLAEARHGVELLRAAGVRVELADAEPGRLRCEVRLSAQPALAGRPARAGKPDDPFA